MYSTETVVSLLQRIRKRLDSETGEGTFWSRSELLEYLNEGVREVWQTARENQQNWFVRELSSTDGVITIGGVSYNTSLLQLAINRSRLLLPPDFHQLLVLEPVNNEDVTLEYANVTQRVFRNGAFDTNSTVGVQSYRYDVIYGPDEPYILIAPRFSYTSAVETHLAYVACPVTLAYLGTFDGTGMTTLMIDAVLAYSCYIAVHKHNLSEQYPSLAQSWVTKKELVSRAAHPKQTRDEEPVEGYLEEEL